MSIPTRFSNNIPTSKGIIETNILKKDDKEVNFDDIYINIQTLNDKLNNLIYYTSENTITSIDNTYIFNYDDFKNDLITNINLSVDTSTGYVYYTVDNVKKEIKISNALYISDNLIQNVNGGVIIDLSKNLKYDSDNDKITDNDNNDLILNVKNINSDIDTLKTDVSNNSNDIDTLKTDYTNLRNSIFNELLFNFAKDSDNNTTLNVLLGDGISLSTDDNDKSILIVKFDTSKILIKNIIVSLTVKDDNNSYILKYMNINKDDNGNITDFTIKSINLDGSDNDTFGGDAIIKYN